MLLPFCINGFPSPPMKWQLVCRVNRITGQVTRQVLFEDQNADHPRVNPLFYSRPTRYMYFNMSHAPITHTSNPPQAWECTAMHPPIC